MSTKQLIRSALTRLFERRGYRVIPVPRVARRHPSCLLVPDVRFPLDLLLGVGRELTYVQIGANDGRTHDPVWSLMRGARVRGFLVEPQQEVCQKLREQYRDAPYMRVLNVAVGLARGKRTLYKLNPRHATLYPHDPSGLASFDPRHVSRHVPGGEGIADLLIEEQVRTVPLMDLLREEGVTEIDLLQVDTEGYDFEVIKMLNFGVVRPRMINYEHRHLSIGDGDACHELLVGQGYLLHVGPEDTLAYRPFAAD